MVGVVGPERAGEREVHPAERPQSEEEQLVRGDVEDTPASLISWVAVAIAVPAVLAVGAALLVYVLT